MFGGLITLAVSAVAGGGVYVGHILTRRSSREATKMQADANAKTNEQVMIDQLQEELGSHREQDRENRRVEAERAAAQDERMLEMERRMTKLDERNEVTLRERDAYRDHAHALRSHIWDGNQPPPPPWPEGLPK